MRLLFCVIIMLNGYLTTISYSNPTATATYSNDITDDHIPLNCSYSNLDYVYYVATVSSYLFNNSLTCNNRCYQIECINSNNNNICSQYTRSINILIISINNSLYSNTTNFELTLSAYKELISPSLSLSPLPKSINITYTEISCDSMEGILK